MKNIFFLFCLTLFTACEKGGIDFSKPEADSLEELPKLRAVYHDYVCCGNLYLLDGPIAGPDDCPDKNILMAINLEDFDIPNKYNYGDTLLITLQLTDVCEANGQDYSCVIACDSPHGLPIELLEVE